MADTLRPRLDHLQELSKKFNAATDNAGRIVQVVETFLTEVCHIGISCSVTMEHDQDEEGNFETKTLVYGRFGPKYRLSVRHVTGDYNRVESEQSNLWANCAREDKLNAYDKLPELLDELIKRVEERLQQVEANTQAIESLVPVPDSRKKGAK